MAGVSSIGNIDTPTFRTQLNAAFARWELDVIATGVTYYVRTDGNDNNTGLVNSAAGAFLTIQKAVDVVASYLLMATVTIQVGDGTYSHGINLPMWTGNAIPKIRGNITTPANCIVSTSASAFSAGNPNAASTNKSPCVWSIGGFTVASSTGDGIAVDGPGVMILIDEPMVFGACTGGHLSARNGGGIRISASYTISGNSWTHYYAMQGGWIDTWKGGTASTVTVSGSRTISYFAYADHLARIYVYNVTFAGTTPTGSKYSATTNACINYSGTLPGSTAGSTATGGLYG